jgi:hypothetical protein
MRPPTPAPRPTCRDDRGHGDHRRRPRPPKARDDRRRCDDRGAATTEGANRRRHSTDAPPTRRPTTPRLDRHLDHHRTTATTAGDDHRRRSRDRVSSRRLPAPGRSPSTIRPAPRPRPRAAGCCVTPATTVRRAKVSLTFHANHGPFEIRSGTPRPDLRPQTTPQGCRPAERGRGVGRPLPERPGLGWRSAREARSRPVHGPAGIPGKSSLADPLMPGPTGSGALAPRKDPAAARRARVAPSREAHRGGPVGEPSALPPVQPPTD